MLFQNLGIIVPILDALKSEGYEVPTPIQAQAIPAILSGRDVVGCAQTGTGKTAAFAIPTIQLLHETQDFSKPRQIQTLILTPTRELGIQIGESFASYGKFTKLKHAVIFGGVTQSRQVDQLRRGIDILIATPGRLLDLMNQGFVDFRFVKLFILDEADRMLDMGFINDVKKIIAKIPTKRQSLFFSATMPNEIRTLSETILNNPIKIEVSPVSSTAEAIEQSVYFVEKGNKKHLLGHLLKDESIISALVFTRTKHGADRLVKELYVKGITAEAIHGNKSQNARQRALGNFKNKTLRVLIATDIAARGIDVDDLGYVFNYDLSNESETYVHRIGRTGRAGASGMAISFCDEEEKEYLRDIQKLIGKQIPIIEDHPYPLATGSKMPAKFSKPKSSSSRGSQTASASTPKRHPNANNQRFGHPRNKPRAR